jgi:hypothetical protein
MSQYHDGVTRPHVAGEGDTFSVCVCVCVCIYIYIYIYEARLCIGSRGQLIRSGLSG